MMWERVRSVEAATPSDGITLWASDPMSDPRSGHDKNVYCMPRCGTPVSVSYALLSPC